MDANVKWVKTGRRKTEGWERKVFKMPRCQQAIRPMMKPGRKNVEKAMAAPGRTFARVGRVHVPATAEARATPLPTSVKPQAKKMRTNRGERSPPRYLFCSGRIRQGPTFRFLARPREEVMTDVENATKKRTELVLLGKMISLPSAPPRALTST